MADVLFLARHGETEWNRQGRKQGHLDSPLTSTGRAQAARWVGSLTDAGVEIVFSSPLGRARETAEIAARGLGAPVVLLETLAEMHHGEFGGMGTAELDEEPAWQLREVDRFAWRFPGGESYASVEPRAAAAIAEVRSHPARRALVVSHEMIGRMLVKTLCGLTTADALAHRHPHGTVFRWDAACPSELVTHAGRDE